MNTYLVVCGKNGEYKIAVECEKQSKARYKVWLLGACDVYETFGHFIKDSYVRRLNI